MQGYAFQKKRRERRWLKWKNVLIVLVYLVLVCGIVIGAMYLYPRLRVTNGDSPEDGVCLTENCLKAALHIVSSMDITQDPCDDFYKFTCGNFIDKAYENNSPSQYYTQMLNIANKLNAVIAESITGEEEGIYLQLKKFYQSCMDVKAIDEEGLESFKKLLEELGGWPVVDGQHWREEDFDLNEFIIKCMDLGFPFQWFFEVTFSDDWFAIHPPKMIRQYNDSYKEYTYLNLMIETAVSFGASSEIALNEMEKILNFEKKLETVIAQQDQIMAVIPLDEVNASTNAIPWLDFIYNITENYTLIQDDALILLNDAYVRQLNLLLAGTSKRVQADFIIWKILQTFGFYLAKPIRDNFLNFTNFMVPEAEQTNTRFKFCKKEVMTRFPRLATAEFIKRYIDEDKIEAVKDMISSIKEQFINRLIAAEWIDESTKEKSINKVKHIVDVIGEHSLEFDEDLVKEFLKLSDLEFTTDNIIDMIRQKNKDTSDQQIKVRNAIQIDYLTNFIFSKTLRVNAAYLEKFNVIFLTAGIIEGIFLEKNRPNYLNYGSLGSIIGHEIAHAFTQAATVYDFQEEEEIMSAWYNVTPEVSSEMFFLNTTELWQEDSLKAFSSRLNCTIEELMKTMDIENDDVLIIENFADLVGIDIAYEAYVEWAEQYEEEQQLPGLPFSPKQLFWIQFGAANCYSRIDSTPWLVETGTHATMRFRVLNTLKNSENFAKDFACPEASVMNPVKKCRIF